MKTLFTSVFAAALMFAACTQAFAQISVNGGFLTSTWGRHQPEKTTLTVTSTGFYVGASYNYDLPVKGLSVDPGLFFTITSKNDNSGMSFLGLRKYDTAKYSESTLNIPLMAKYTITARDSAPAYLKFGPVMEFGLSAKTRTKDTSIPESDRTLNNYKNGDFKRFNLYLGGEAGADLGNFCIYIGIYHGLLNTAGDNFPSDVHLRRTLLLMGISYKLDNLLK